MSQTEDIKDGMDDSSAPLIEHLTELRSRLIRAVAAFVVANWNSRAIPRALPTNCPTLRNSIGKSFGPTTIKATMPITSISAPPIPNMA